MLENSKIAIDVDNITITVTTVSGNVSATFDDGASFNEMGIYFEAPEGEGGYIEIAITDGYYCNELVIHIVVNPDFAPENPWLEGGDVGGGDGDGEVDWD